MAQISIGCGGGPRAVARRQRIGGRPRRVSSMAQISIGCGGSTGTLARSRWAKVALKSAMATAFFYMAGAWDFQLGAEFVAHELMHGMIAHRDAQLGRNPLLHGTVRRKAGWAFQRGVQLGQLGRREGRSFARWNVHAEQGGKAAFRTGRA